MTASFDDPMIVGAMPKQLIYQNLMIKGTLTASRRDISEVLDLASRGKIKPITTGVYPFDKLPEAVKRVEEGQVAGRLIVDFNQ